MADEATNTNNRCPGCGNYEVKDGAVTRLKHGKDLVTGGDCREKLNAEYKRDAERATKLLENPAEYMNWISKEMTIHLVRLDRKALGGDTRSIKEFREAGMEIAAGLAKKQEKRYGPQKQAEPGAPVGDADRGPRGEQGAGGAASGEAELAEDLEE